MKIFISGANGLVGRNILEHPVAGNFELLAPLREELDLLDRQAVADYLTRSKPDMVIHAAGKVGGIQANMREPVRFFIENLDMGRNVVWAARQAGVKRLINLGSSCMYPRHAVNPLNENCILTGELEPTNEGYALAKIAVARLCRYINQEDPDYAYKTLIPCNLYGRWDKFDPAHSHLIPAVIHKLHQAKTAGLDEVEIWGDGMARREFMDAADLADCLAAVVQNYQTMPEVMNVGLGFDYSINEYYLAAAKVIGYGGRFVHDLSRPVGMQQKVVDVESLAAWGWKPGTTLEDGLKRAYSFYLEHFCAGVWR
jgi:GDP-L-fucose synthase